MKKFNDYSIKRKLTLIITLTCIITLFFACFAFIATEFIFFRQTMVENNTTLAKTIGINCQAALTFKDKEAAKETLSALGAVPNILSGSIYKPDGNIFARYITNSSHKDTLNAGPHIGATNFAIQPAQLAGMIEKGPNFHGRHLELLQPILLDGEIIGYIYLQSSLKSLYTRLYWYVSICGVILLLSSFVAYLLSAGFQRTVSKPILDLSEKMTSVSLKKDYSIRVDKKSNDELGTLFDGFNDMLAKIQERDEALYLTQYFIDHMDEPAFWLDSEARFIYVNDSACSALEYSQDEILSITIQHIDTNFSPNVWQEHWKTLIRKRSFTFESKYKKKNGEIFPVEVNVNYVEFKGKQYYCAFARDLSERKLIESKLEQAQKLEAIGTLTGGVAHDLNNVLGGLVGYPELILMDMPKDSPLIKPLTRIKESGVKAAAIVQDLLTLARRGAVVHNVVNLNEIISDYLETPEHETLARFHPGIEFKIDLEPNLLNTIGSSIHISKTIMNLVSNAAEAIKKGGTVCIYTINIHLDKSLSGFELVQAGDYVKLTVSDTGKGILLKDQKKIFEPFYTKKTMGRSGTGLGMTVVRGTMEDHNGYIDIQSSEGMGTKFHLYFPITPRELIKSIESFSIKNYKGNESILVVDDVKEQREIAEAMLTSLGYNVDTVSSGEEAVEYIRRDKADLLILDMIMDPGIDGLETYQKILKINPKQKVIIASGFSETDRVKEAQRIGAGAYVKKPYLIERIAVSVRTALDK